MKYRLTQIKNQIILHIDKYDYLIDCSKLNNPGVFHEKKKLKTHWCVINGILGNRVELLEDAQDFMENSFRIIKKNNPNILTHHLKHEITDF